MSKKEHTQEGGNQCGWGAQKMEFLLTEVAAFGFERNWLVT